MDIDKLKVVIEDILAKHGLSTRSDLEPKGRGDLYVVKTKEAVLRLTFGPQWIGYELQVAREATGRKMSDWLDTDLYPLGGKFEEISTDIFNDTVACTEALLDGSIRVGKVGRKYLLAIPEANGTYRLSTRGRFTTTKESVSKNKLPDGLRPLR